MYYNGTIIRLLPDEMIKVFQTLFWNSDQNNTFIQNYYNKDDKQRKEQFPMIFKILCDQNYQAFAQKYC